mgnify:CR=1 FL=1
MEKKHVMIMMFCETIVTTLISLAGGILLGVLFSKLMFLLLVKLVGFSTAISIGISTDAIVKTILIYTPIFMVSYLFNVIQIKLANPIELLEVVKLVKRTKDKWLLTIIGVLTLGGGYFIAQTIEDPATAILLFFIAVILVIIGTYCLFTAGSIAILKMLKANKHFYYQTKTFYFRFSIDLSYETKCCRTCKYLYFMYMYIGYVIKYSITLFRSSRYSK